MTISIRPPSIDSDIFNPNFFINSGDVLTLDVADQLYLDKTDYRLTYISSVKTGEASPMSALVVDANRDITNINSISCSSLKLNGSNVDLSNLSLLSASPGTASNNKALIVGASGQIGGLSSLTATNITGTLQTASQPNITSIGTLSNLTVSGGITGTLQTAAQPNITSIGTLSSLTATSITGTLQTAAQPNITSVGTLGSLIINSVFAKGLAIQNDSTTSAASLNLVSFYQMEQGVRGSANATAANTYFWRFANTDRLLMDINGNINNSGSSINASYKLDVNEAIRGTSFVQGTTTYDLSLIPRLSLTTLGTVEASKSLVADASYGITGLRSLTLVGSGLSKSLVIQNDTTTSAASLNFASYYQAEVGVRGSANTSGANQFFLKYALSDRLIMDMNGNVNIGGSSINTSYLLDVNGALNCNSLTIGGVAISPQTNIFPITAGTSFTSTTRASDFNLLIRNQSNTVGAQAGLSFVIEGTGDLTTDTPSVNVYCTRTATASQYSMADFAISTRSSFNSLSPMTERMRITQAGYIRFGSSSSNAKLDITSSTNLLSGSWQRAMRIANDQSTPIEFEIQIATESSAGTNGVALGTTTSDPLRLMVGNSTQCYINSSGRLAVDLSNWSPEGTIHASGAIWSNYGFHCKSSSVSPMYRWQNSTTSYPCIGNHVNASAGIRFATCDGSWVYNGYAPCYGGAYTNSSDRRLKKDIVDLPYGLNEVLQMKPRQFSWISDNKRAIGFIAQEMIDIVPEPVYVPEGEEADELNPDGTPKTGWGVDYACLTSILCRAIQEQQQQIEELKSELDELRAIISD